MISLLAEAVGYGEIFFCPDLTRLARRVGHTNEYEFLPVSSAEWTHLSDYADGAIIRFIPDEFTKCGAELPDYGNERWYNPAMEAQHRRFMEWLNAKYPDWPLLATSYEDEEEAEDWPYEPDEEEIEPDEEPDDDDVGEFG